MTFGLDFWPTFNFKNLCQITLIFFYRNPKIGPSKIVESISGCLFYKWEKTVHSYTIQFNNVAIRVSLKGGLGLGLREC